MNRSVSITTPPSINFETASGCTVVQRQEGKEGGGEEERASTSRSKTIVAANVSLLSRVLLHSESLLFLPAAAVVARDMRMHPEGGHPAGCFA